MIVFFPYIGVWTFAGLIAVVIIIAITAVGTKLNTKFDAVSTALN